MRTSDAKFINDILNTLKFEDRVLVKTRMKFGKYGLQRGFAIKMKSWQSWHSKIRLSTQCVNHKSIDIYMKNRFGWQSWHTFY